MPNTSIKIAPEALYILYQLEQAGYQSFVVGGAVRDLLQQVVATDYDFTTDAKPEEIMQIFEDAFYENQFGTVMITPDDLHSHMVKNIRDASDGNMTLTFDNTDEDDTIKNNDKTSQRLIDLSQATKIHASLKEVLPGNKQDDKKNSSNKKQGLGQNGSAKSIKNQTNRNYEITTFRSESSYQDHRHPSVVTWGKNLDEDLKRRDFTINAMALSIKPDFLKKQVESWSKQTTLPSTIEVKVENYQLTDPHHGQEDLANNIIQTVGEPEQRFGEDALRMLRAIRLAVELEFQILDKTYEAIIKKAPLTKHVSWERIRDEFLKMLASDHPRSAIRHLDETGLLDFVLPEIKKGKGVEQGGHHTTDVWTHSLDALAACPSPDPIVRLATLLHDVAKPHTYKVINGQPTFYNHEVVGARIAKKIGRRLRLSRQDQNRLFILVRYHMFHYQPENTDAAIRRFMRKVGLENIDDILDLREADRLGSGARKTSWRLEEMKQRMIEQLHQPMSTHDLAVDGHVLMKKLGLKPGPVIGVLLNKLLELVLEKPELNEQSKLIKEAQELMDQAQLESQKL